MRRKRGFTLIELLVVVAIITALLAILLPSLNKAISVANTAVCMSQQKQVHMAITSYHASNHLRYAPRLNWGRWYSNVAKKTPIDNLHANAYWGVAYADEIGFEAGRQLFNCPEALDSDMNTVSSNPSLGYTDGTFEAGHVYNTYGFNGLRDSIAISQGASKGAPFYDDAAPGDPGVTLAAIKNPAGIIEFQDAFEHNLDGNGDMPWSFTQWSGGQNREYFRHHLDTAGNVVWGDGHASTVGIDEDWTIWLYAAY